MKIIRIILLFLFCLLLGFTFGHISYNMSVTISRNSLLSDLDSVNPEGRYLYVQTIEQQNEGSKDAFLTSIFRRIKQVGVSDNGEFIYELPNWMWLFVYRERKDDGNFVYGRSYPIQIVSRFKIDSESEFSNIIHEAYNTEIEKYSNYTREKLSLHDDVSEIMNSSKFHSSPRIQSFIKYQYEPYSSEYVVTSFAKVLVKKEESISELVLKPKDEKIYKSICYGFWALISIITFLILIRKINQSQSNKRIGIASLVIVSWLIIVSGLYFNHYTSIKKEYKEYQIRQYETDFRIRYPKLENLIRSVVDINNLELEYAKSYFDPFSPHESISRVINYLYASSSELRKTDYMCNQQISLEIGAKSIAICEDDEKTKKTRVNYQEIAWTLKRLNEMNIFDIESSTDLTNYESQCDSLKERIRSLQSDILNDNRIILDR